MMNDEGQDIKTVYSFARIDFCSKYIRFALLKLLSTQTFVLLPLLDTKKTKFNLFFLAAYLNQFLP